MSDDNTIILVPMTEDMLTDISILAVDRMMALHKDQTRSVEPIEELMRLNKLVTLCSERVGAIRMK